MKSNVRIGTRGSKLALWQANHLADLLRQKHPGIEIELETIKTTGDRVLDRPLAEIGGKGLFVKEIEDALLSGRIDLAIHSLKDVPAELPPGLGLVTFLPREDPRDALCVRGRKNLAELPEGAHVGTSSLRRQVQLKRARPDLRISPLRGNVDTRLRKLDDGEYDAIILAAAGLKRLGLDGQIGELVSTETMIPAVGQGILAIEARLEDMETRHLLGPLNDSEASEAARCERALLAGMGGSCWLPMGAHARQAAGGLLLTAFVSSIDGSCFLRHDATGTDPVHLGTETAEWLIGNGGRQLLKDIQDRHGN